LPSLDSSSLGMTAGRKRVSLSYIHYKKIKFILIPIC